MAGQPRDLRKKYRAPFAIFSPEEGKRYTELTSRSYNPPQCLDLGLIKNPDIRKAIRAHCSTLGLAKFDEIKHDAYEELMLEFYTTFNFSDDEDDGVQFSCRLRGKNVTVTCKTLRDIFGFPKGGLKSVPDDFNAAEFWKEISDGRVDFKTGKAYSGQIKDPLLLLMHRYVTHVVFGRADSGKVTARDLLYLSCLSGGNRVSNPCFLIAAFNFIVNNIKRTNMCLGNVITAIAVHFGAFDPKGMKVVPTRALRVTAIENVLKAGPPKEVALSSTNQADHGEDTVTPAVAVVDQKPVANAWILNSCKVEQMLSRMNDAMEARFDGLEKKVNHICGHFEELEGMKREIFEANITIENLRLEKSEYKTTLEKCFKIIKKMEESHDKRWSMKEGVNDILKHKLGSFSMGGNRWTSLDDDYDPIWMTLISNESTSKGRVTEKAARDDKTSPKGAAENSKRVLSSDKINLVQNKGIKTESVLCSDDINLVQNKRIKTERMESFFTSTKGKKDVQGQGS